MGTSTYVDSQLTTIPTPPITPNWLKPRKSVSASEA
jgi:hypothetical protein